MMSNEERNLPKDDYSGATVAQTSGIMNEDFVRTGAPDGSEQEFQREGRTFWQDAWSQLTRNKLAVVGMIGLVIIILFALIGPLLNSHDFAEQDVQRRNLSLIHI